MSGGHDPFFSWEGMKAVHGDDQKLVSDVGTEMDEHGAGYSQTAKNYSEGLRGFFGARVAGVDAADWAGAKAAEAGSGIGGFVDGAKDWQSLGDAGHGIAGGVSKAGHWLADTAGEAWDGAAGEAKSVVGLGWPGAVGAAAGFGDVALPGGRSLAGAAWDGVKSAGAKAWSWLAGE